MVIKIPREKIKKIDIVNIKGGMTAIQVYKKYKPDYMINLALYDTASGTNITHLKDEGVVSGYLFSNEGIGIKGDAEITWTTKDDNSVRDYVSGSPVLLKNGKKNIDWGNKVSQYVQGSHKRSVIGFNNQDMMLYTSNEELTLNELQDSLIWHGFDYAINCDGGGSCHLQEGEKIYTKSVRSNASWLLIYRKEVTQMPKRYKVCIDPGHGGNDPGAVSGKLYEKNINLEVALAMKDFLQPYVDVVMTRSTDITLSLEERVRIANEANVNFFFSIHCNSASNTAAKGWECFIVSKGGKAEKLAIRIQAHVFEEPTLTLKNRGIKTDNYYVLRYTDAPAVIVENAFISNSDDRVNILKSKAALNYLAVCYANAICDMCGIRFDLDEATEENTTPFDWSLTVLEANGVITDAEYWRNNKDKVQYLEQLIINMANYIEKNK
jgi:N-acetylmuramoyl-L-alanine amidase